MTTDSGETFRYDKMVEKALRDVVRQALQEVAKNGLTGEHHFYITFFTAFPDVKIPAYLKERYPDEMTIVLQHQFYDLEIDAEKFSVMLNFNNVPERLVIPFAAITIFADPSVNFALQFQPLTDDDAEDPDEALGVEAESASGAQKSDKDKKGEVISLDTFRKKGKGKDKDKDKT